METEQNKVDFHKLFEEVKTVAVVGYSDREERAGYFVPKYLSAQGYTIISVNPKFGSSVNGFANYASLSEIPEGTEVDVIDVFRSPPHVPALAEEAAEMQPKPKYFVMQPGAESEEAWQIAKDAGITPVMACLLAEHRRLAS